MDVQLKQMDRKAVPVRNSREKDVRVDIMKTNLGPKLSQLRRPLAVPAETPLLICMMHYTKMPLAPHGMT